MFARRYWPATYYAARYWPPALAQIANTVRICARVLDHPGGMARAQQPCATVLTHHSGVARHDVC